VRPDANGWTTHPGENARAVHENCRGEIVLSLAALCLRSSLIRRSSRKKRSTAITQTAALQACSILLQLQSRALESVWEKKRPRRGKKNGPWPFWAPGHSGHSGSLARKIDAFWVPGPTSNYVALLCCWRLQAEAGLEELKYAFSEHRRQRASHCAGVAKSTSAHPL